MNDRQRAMLATIRADLGALCFDMRVSRNAAPTEEKGAFRYPLRRLEHADAQLKFAEQDDDRRRKGKR